MGGGALSLSLDSIANAATYFAGVWQSNLKGNQSRDVLRLIIGKLYGVSHGHIFNAHVRCSHAALADALDLSREWTCKLISRLRDAGWIKTEARRLPDGTQEITIFRPGRMLKRLLVMLLRSRQRQSPAPSRVNNSSQKIPTKQEIEKNKDFLAQLRLDLAAKLSLSKT